MMGQIKLIERACYCLYCGNEEKDYDAFFCCEDCKNAYRKLTDAQKKHHRRALRLAKSMPPPSKTEALRQAVREAAELHVHYGDYMAHFKK